MFNIGRGAVWFMNEFLENKSKNQLFILTTINVRCMLIISIELNVMRVKEERKSMVVEITKATIICKALGDVNRMSIVQTLTTGEKCACELLESLDITQSTLSYHMKILEECQLVTSRNDWRNTYYSLDCNTWQSFKKFIEKISCICDL